MTYEEALKTIHSAGMHSQTPGLGRIRLLLDALGNPQDAVRCIHVAGTNGKGSVSAMLDSILRRQGYRVGLFTSPYIRTFNERMKVDGEMISDWELAALTEEVTDAAHYLGTEFTEFELITAIGFTYFKRHHVDVTVLEVGLGGRLDPTNVIQNPYLSIITGIDYDHTSLLGDTIQEIAVEKAGIIKEKRPTLYGGKDINACRAIFSVASRKNSPFTTVDRESFNVRELTLEGTTVDFGEMKGLHVNLLGTYQVSNIETVLTATEILNREGLKIEEPAIREGLEEARWIARFELLSRENPTVICDGAHNPQGIHEAVKSIKKYFPDQKVNLLTGVMADKNYDEMIEQLRPVTEHAYTVTPSNPRALSAAEYAAEFLAHKIPATAYETVKDAAFAAVKDSREKNIPLIELGSLYLYAEAADGLTEALAQD